MLNKEERELLTKTFENNDITSREMNERLGFGVDDKTVKQHVVKPGYRY